MRRTPKSARIVVQVAGAILLIIAAVWGVMFLDFYKIPNPRPGDITLFAYMWILAVVLFASAGLGLILLKPWSRLPAMCMFGTVGGYITFVMFAFRSLLGVAIILPSVIGVLILFGTDWIKSGFYTQAKDNGDSQQSHAEPTSEPARCAASEEADA